MSRACTSCCPPAHTIKKDMLLLMESMCQLGYTGSESESVALELRLHSLSCYQ